MANGYKSQQVGLTSLSDLLQIINYVGGGNKQQNYGSLFNMHAEHLGSYDNDQIDISVANINSYLDKYRDKMGDVEIEQYDLMLDKYSQQKTRNENYQTDYDLFATRYNDGILELGEDYVNATSATSCDYTTKTTDANGQVIQTQHKVNFPDWESLGYSGPNDPEFLKSSEYVAFMDEVGGVDGYIAARNDYKIHVKNKLEDEIESFVKGKQKFERDYADRLGSGVYRNDALNLEEMKFTYGFLLDSIEDGVLDTEERKAYEDALMRSEVTPITDFNAKTGEVRRISREMTMDNMVTNVNNADIFNNHLNQFDNILDVDMTQVSPTAPYMTIPGELVGNDKAEPVTLNYQQVYDYASAINPTPEMLADPVYNYLTSVGGLLQRTKDQLQQQDENLIKNSGASFINTLHDKDWLDDVRPGGVGFIPGQPTTPKLTPPDTKGNITGIKIDMPEEELREADITLTEIMPDVTLKATNRMDRTLHNRGNIDTMIADVEKIINIVGGLDTDVDELSEIEKLVGNYLPLDGLYGLQRMINKYNKEFKAYEKRLESWEKTKASNKARGMPFYEVKPTPNLKIARKILTRYNTILGKIKKRIQ